MALDIQTTNNLLKIKKKPTVRRGLSNTIINFFFFLFTRVRMCSDAHECIFFSYEIINNDDDDDKKEKSMEIFRRKQIEKKNGENLKSDFYLFFIRGSDKN